MKTQLLITLAVSMLLALPAGAQSINNIQAEEQARINAGLRDGSLTQMEAARLQARANHIADVEGRLRATGGHLSFSERQRLSNELNSLSNQIYRERHDNQRSLAYRQPFGGNINRREAREQWRIDQGIRDGSLNQKEAWRLEHKFDRVNAEEARMRASGGGLNYFEREKLNHDLNHLNKDIHHDRHDYDRHDYDRHDWH